MIYYRARRSKYAVDKNHIQLYRRKTEESNRVRMDSHLRLQYRFEVTSHIWWNILMHV